MGNLLLGNRILNIDSNLHRNELNFQLSTSKPAQTLLLNFHAIIRFQPFHFYPQTLCRKGIAAETRKYYPLQEGTVDKGECFQRFQLFSGLPIELYIQRSRYVYSPYWFYMSTTLDIYIHHVGKSGVKCGLMAACSWDGTHQHVG